MVRYFSNPFGWDWLPRGENIYDISSGDTWGFSNTWSPYFDKWEELKKTAKTFEEIKKVAIHLTFEKDPIATQAEKDEETKERIIESTTERDKKKSRFGFRHNQLTSIGTDYYLNINPTNEKYLTNEAKVEHNISHILYDTPIKESRLQAHRLSLGAGIPEKLKDDKLAVSPDCNLCEDIIRHVFDIIEDTRVNSLWGELYLGTQQDYEKCQSKVAKQMKGDVKNPVDALWRAYNGKTDDSEMSQVAAEFIAKAKGLDYPGGLYLQKQYFQHVILPWLKEQNFDQNEKNSKQKSKDSKDNKSSKQKTKKNQKNDSPSIEDILKALQKSIKDVRSKHDAFTDHRGLQTNLNNKKRKQIEKMLAEGKIDLNKMQGNPTFKPSSEGNQGKACATETIPGKNKGDPIGEFSEKPGIGGGQGKSYDMFDPTKLEKMRARGRERNNKIRNALVSKGLMKDKTLEAYNFDPETFDIVTRHMTCDPYVIDHTTVQRLMRIWQQAKGATREIIDEEGEEIDIDSYIQQLPSAYKDNDIFVSSKDEPGLHIVYSADCSGSMDGFPLKLLRDVTATIKKSLEREPKIKMSMIGWGGGVKTGISVHSTMDDINKFTVLDHYGGTPEANALWYSSTWLQRQPEVSKVIFFVSDGAFSTELAKEQVEIARGNNLHVFGIGICDQGMDEQYRYIFGPGNYTIVDEGSYKSGLNRLINDIATFISCHIKAVA